MGDLVDESSTCYYCLPFLFPFLVFPYILIFSGWWDLHTSTKYSIDHSQFKQICDLLKEIQPTRLELRIADNTFDRVKANHLDNLLNESSVSNLRVTNYAQETGWKFNEYSNFRRNTSRLRENPSCKMLKWRDKVAKLV